MDRLSRLFLIAALLAGAVVPGCRCASGDDRATTEGEGEGEGEGTGEGAGTGDAWVEGDLAAQTPDDEGEPVRGGEVTVQIYSNPPSLNPITDNDWWGSRLVDHIYGKLVTLDPYDHPGYAVVPELAERWDISDDKLTYTFHLRRGVKWHDGHDFTSRDVIATIDKVMDETVKAAHVRSYFEELESYTAPDDYTVVIKWKRPYFLALEDPWASSLVIQPAHIIADMTGAQYNEAATNPLNRAPVGTGPFRFERWDAMERIVLVRNDEYWGDQPHLDRMTFRHVEDPAIALQLAERGELDVVTRILPEPWSRMDSRVLRENYRRSKYYDANYAWIGWNQARPFFADRRVRRAMTMLMNRERLLQSMFYGVYRLADCHFYFDSPICDYEHDPIPHDPVAAAALLDEAGWRDSNGNGVRDKDGVEFEFNFMVPAASEDARRMGTFMKESFQRAGISMDLQPIEWSAFTRRLTEKSFDACTLLWASSGPRQDPTQIWHSSSIDGGSNYIGFRNERADRLMEEARVELDESVREAKYREFMQILWEEQPYTFVYVRPRMSLVHDRIRGVKESLTFFQYADWWIPEDQRRNRGGS